LLKDRNVRWLYAGQIISQVGDGVTKVALLWFVYNTTESALKMTLIGVLQTVPPLIFGPFAGVVLDRMGFSEAEFAKGPGEGLTPAELIVSCSADR